MRLVLHCKTLSIPPFDFADIDGVHTLKYPLVSVHDGIFSSILPSLDAECQSTIKRA
jgi:hypothetical protein